MTKRILNILTLILLLLHNFGANCQTKTEIKNILDSLEVLKQTGGFFDGVNFPTAFEDKRLDNITKLLYKLPYNELQKLQSDQNTLSKAYGFTLTAKKYFDSIVVENNKIFIDTSKILMYSEGKLIDMEMNLGQFCEMIYGTIVEEHNNENLKPEIVKAIESYIINNSKFPNSYKPIEYIEYSWGSAENEPFYSIKHKYKLKTKSNKNVEVEHYFILNRQLEIEVIEKQKTGTVSSKPPITKEWLIVYGK